MLIEKQRQPKVLLVDKNSNRYSVIPVISLENPNFPVFNPVISVPNPVVPVLNRKFSVPNPVISVPNPVVPVPNPKFPVPNPVVPVLNRKFSVPNPVGQVPNRNDTKKSLPKAEIRNGEQLFLDTVATFYWWCVFYTFSKKLFQLIHLGLETRRVRTCFVGGERVIIQC